MAVTSGLAILLTLSLCTGAQAASSPENTDPPTAVGQAEIGQTLTATKGGWTADPAIPDPAGYSYQWQRCDAGDATTTFFGSTGSNPRAITLDDAGNVYTTNYGSDNVTRITPDGNSITFAATGDDPHSIALDSSGNFYVANSNSDDITKITPDGTPTTPFASTGDFPLSLALDSAGNIYTANWSSDNVTKVTPDGASSTTFASTGRSPQYVVLDSAENLYTANAYSNTVTKITPDGIATTLGTTGGQPIALTLDSAGNVYTADYGSSTVTKITPDGISTTLGTTGSGPSDIAFDSFGNLYTANYFSGNVTRITPDGVSTNFSTGGFGTVAITRDAAGNFYTANYESNNVTKLSVSLSCTDIEGADEASYTAGLDDYGKSLRVKVTATNGVPPDGVAFSEPTSPVAGVAPENTAAPTISAGAVMVGDTVTKTGDGTWTGIPTPTLAFHWQRCDADGTDCTDIAGATGTSYTAVADDSGKALRLEVTATNSAGSLAVSSNPTGQVEPEPPVTFELSVTRSGTGAGTVTSSPAGIACGSDCAANFEQESTVTLSAAAAAGSSFSGWSGAGCSGDGSCEVTMNEAQAVTATFTADPPPPPPPPSGKPKLSIELDGPKRVRAGRQFTIRMKVTNRAEGSGVQAQIGTDTDPTTAANVKACVSVPRRVVLMKNRDRSRIEGRKVCWTRGSLPAGSSVAHKLRAKTVRSASGAITFRANASAANTEGVTATKSDRVKVAPAKKAKPRPRSG